MFGAAATILILAALAYLLVVFIPNHMGKVGRPEIDAAWTEAARALDAELDLGSAMSPRRLTAEIDGIRVQLDHQDRTTVDGLTESVTRAIAKGTAPPDFKIRIDRTTLIGGLARAVGFQDVPVGDAEFDDDFIVKSNDPTAAKLYVNAKVRQAIRESPDFRYELKNRKVTAIADELIVDPDDLVHAAVAVAALADGRQRVMAQWAKVAAEHVGQVERKRDGWVTMTLEVDGVAVTVDSHKLRDDHYTFARARVAAPLEPFVLACDKHAYPGRLPKAVVDLNHGDYDLWTADPQAAQAQLDDEAWEAIEGLQPSKVAGDDKHVTVTWRGITTNRRKLKRGIQAAITLSRCAMR